MSNRNGDRLLDLPTDKSKPLSEDLDMMNIIFSNKNNSKMSRVFVDEIKDPIIVGVLYGIVSSGILDDILYKTIPISRNSKIILLLSKVVLVMILYWIIKNISLVRTTKV